MFLKLEPILEIVIRKVQTEFVEGKMQSGLATKNVAADIQIVVPATETLDQPSKVKALKQTMQ